MQILHLLSVLTALLEGITSAGLVFGWPSLSHILKQQGYFSSHCDVTNTTASPVVCDRQKEALVAVSTVGSVCFSLGALAAGFIYDHCGTMITRVYGTLLFTAGCFLFLASDSQTAWLLYPSMTLLSIGGVLLYTSNVKLGNLFPAWRATFFSLFEGVIDSSAVVFHLVKLAFERGVTMKISFLFILASTLLQWLRTIFLMPRMFIPFPLPRRNFPLGACSKHKRHYDEITDVKSTSSKTSKGAKPLKASLRDIKFWLNALHMALLQLRIDFFVCTLDDWLLSTFPNLSNSDISGYIGLYGSLTLCTLFMAPLNGACIDIISRYLSYFYDDETVILKSNAVSLALTSLLGLVFSLAVCYPTTSSLCFVFLILFTEISFVYAGSCNYIALAFPEEHFGRLMGLTEALACVSFALQYPLAVYVYRVYKGNYLPVNIVFIFVCLMTFVHPYLLFTSSPHPKSQRYVSLQNSKVL